MGGLDKRTLRRELLQRRRLLSAETVDSRSRGIIRQIAQLIHSRPALQTFHCFLPIERNREVNTWLLIEHLVAKDKQVVVSSTDFEAQTMHHFQYEPDLEFTWDKMGIPSPVDARAASLADCDAVLMPLVTADKKGGRIGYGGGYYDRLLADMPEVLKIGLSISPLFDGLPMLEPHDVRLDYCITPRETIDCKHG